MLQKERSESTAVVCILHMHTPHYSAANLFQSSRPFDFSVLWGLGVRALTHGSILGGKLRIDVHCFLLENFRVWEFHRLGLSV